MKPTTTTDGRIVYIFDDELIRQCDRIPVIKKRASRVHDLIESYDLLEHFTIRSSKLASKDDLLLYHSGDYVDVIEGITGSSENEQIEEEYGLNYDCPKIPKLFEFCRRIAGGTISAADAILEGAEVAINWCGGWHHAQRDKAEGFCYVNDIVIGIQKLASKFDRILYIDMDVHHGNGVENAFCSTKRVLTLSFHQHEAGFYPGSGGQLEAGFGAAVRGYAVNFPFKQHLNGRKYVEYFKLITSLVIEKYKAEVIVLQCGADILAGDPLGGANVSTLDMGECVTHIKAFNIPLMALGGGGYNLQNTARYWTYLTSILCDKVLEEDLPDNEYFLEYGPTYELHVERKPLKDENDGEELQRNYETICRNIEGIMECKSIED